MKPAEREHSKTHGFAGGMAERMEARTAARATAAKRIQGLENSTRNAFLVNEPIQIFYSMEFAATAVQKTDPKLALKIEKALMPKIKAAKYLNERQRKTLAEVYLEAMRKSRTK